MKKESCRGALFSELDCESIIMKTCLYNFDPLNPTFILNLDVSTNVNRGFGLKSETKWQTVYILATSRLIRVYTVCTRNIFGLADRKGLNTRYECERQITDIFTYLFIYLSKRAFGQNMYILKSDLTFPYRSSMNINTLFSVWTAYNWIFYCLEKKIILDSRYALDLTSWTYIKWTSNERKRTFWHVHPTRTQITCASAQSDQSLRCPH